MGPERRVSGLRGAGLLERLHIARGVGIEIWLLMWRGRRPGSSAEEEWKRQRRRERKTKRERDGEKRER